MENVKVLVEINSSSGAFCFITFDKKEFPNPKLFAEKFCENLPKRSKSLSAFIRKILTN